MVPDSISAVARSVLTFDQPLRRLRGVNFVGFLLPVDPPVAQRGIEGIAVGDGRDLAALLGDAQPHARGLGVVQDEPFVPLTRRSEEQHGQIHQRFHRPQRTIPDRLLAPATS